MANFEKILVALDYSDIDNQLIVAASWVSKYTLAKEVRFINVIREINLPDSIKEQFPNIMADAVTERKKEIQLKIDQFFTNKDTKVKIEIKSGQPTKSILKYSESKEIDLIIMGRKNDKKGGGIIVNRVARRAHCSLLIIPKDFNREIKKVLVPIDFSVPSQEAMETTIKVIKNGTCDIKILAQKVYQVPSGYHYTGKSFTEFARIMKENEEKEYHQFMSKIDASGSNIETLYSLDKNDDIISVIMKTAKKQHVDAIVISTKGMTSTRALFLGSKAEKIIHQHSDVPLIVIRPKCKQEGLWDYLKNL